MVDVKVSKSMQDGRILVSFLYNPKFIAKVKSVACSFKQGRSYKDSFSSG